jgi:hypothetical protein
MRAYFLNFLLDVNLHNYLILSALSIIGNKKGSKKPNGGQMSVKEKSAIKKRFCITKAVEKTNRDHNAEIIAERETRSALFRCRNAIGFLTKQRSDNEKTEINISSLSCKRWQCPDCARLKAKIFQKKLIEAHAAGLNNMITITCYRSHGKKESWETISTKFHKICRYIRDHFHKDLQWIYSIEAHKDGFPHIHCLINFPITDRQLKEALKASKFGYNRHTLYGVSEKVCIYMSKYLASDLHKTGNIKYVKGRNCRIVQCCRKLGAIFNFASDNEFDEIFTCADNIRNPKFDKQAKRIYRCYNNLIYEENGKYGKITLCNTPLSETKDLFGNIVSQDFGERDVRKFYKSSLKFLLDKFQQKTETEKIFFGGNFTNSVNIWHNNNEVFSGHQKIKTKTPILESEGENDCYF